MTNRVLAEMDFASIISNSNANTQTGAEVINKYKSYVMAHESSCDLVNNFIREASRINYDNGVNEAVGKITDYITANKTSWALATACESIDNNRSSHNYINRNASKQVAKLLEMNEEDVVKYIKAGALKNVMYCESFRSIAKQVYKDTPLIESCAEYTRVIPVSITENVGDGICFAIAGSVYKIDEERNIINSTWSEVSNTFKSVASLLDANMTEINEDSIVIKLQNATYTINESCKVTRKGREGEKTMSVEELREHNNLVVATITPKYKHNMAAVLESIALTCEQFDNIAKMDNCSIYTTANDKVLVIESEDKIYAELLRSNRHAKWSINENAIDAISFIKNKTNISLSDNYKEVLEKAVSNADETEKNRIIEELKNQENNSYRERIEKLTEKFKNDPVKLAVLSKLAQELNENE